MNLRNPILLGVVVTGIAGCQSYQRRPLALADHASQWVHRALDVEPVSSYAASLADDPDDQAPFDSTDGLSLHEAEAVALHFNPQLRIARAQADVPLASAREAGWWPDPKFQAAVQRFLDRGKRTRFRLDGPSIDGVNTRLIGQGGLSAEGIEATPPGIRRTGGEFIDDPWIIATSLSVTIPISGRLAVEEELKWSEYSAAWRRILVSEWRLLTRLREAWFEWSTTRERSNVTRDYLRRLEDIASIAEQLAQAGEMKTTEARVLRIELARQRARLGLLEGETSQKRWTVHALMGIAPNTPVELEPRVWVASTTVKPEDRRQVLVEKHPQIITANADYETTEQRLRLEIRRQYPDLQVGPRYSFEEGFSRFGFDLGFPIPLWNRNRQAIAEATAARNTARIRAETVVELVCSELARTESRLRKATQQREYLISEVAPLVDRQVEDSRALLKLGEVDVLLLRDALAGSLETKLEVLDAKLAEARAANVVEQMLQPRWVTPTKRDTKED